MTVVHIGKKSDSVKKIAVFDLGFRPFFIGAAVVAVVSILVWLSVYFGALPVPLQGVSSFQWHAHEMIYGFCMAVISGFLLTAVMNWTGVTTIHGIPLALLFGLWLLARIAFLFGTGFLEYAAIVDILFNVGLLVAVGAPIVRVKQWKNLGILSKVVVLTLGNISFYLGAFGVLERGAHWGIYGGLYSIIALIMVIEGRVFPGFVRNALGQHLEFSTPAWMMLVNLLLFSGFFVNQLFFQQNLVQGYLASGLFVVTSLKLYFWYAPGMWSHSLVWCLYVPIVFINLGFFLTAIGAFFGIYPFLAVHAFAVGAIGVVTLGMMMRVSLGHTGRNIRKPTRLTAVSLWALVVGGIFRVIVPLFDMTHYSYWLVCAQIAWVLAFSMFLLGYGKMLVQGRVDGQPG